MLYTMTTELASVTHGCTFGLQFSISRYACTYIVIEGKIRGSVELALGNDAAAALGDRSPRKLARTISERRAPPARPPAPPGRRTPLVGPRLTYDSRAPPPNTHIHASIRTKTVALRSLFQCSDSATTMSFDHDELRDE
ncbi:hypothetical protein O0L34_g11351 [Tuta absoluta]|nr:hypothetical protein O0L34_g11351 [Tuta absoluta]